MARESIVCRLRNRACREISAHFGRRLGHIESDQPLISFTFDDFPVSALEVAGGILEARGLRGTFFASFGLRGCMAPTGMMFSGDHLQSLTERGHELGCHTFSHLHAWNTSRTIYEASLEANKAAFSIAVPGAKVSTHSYPISVPKPAIKRVVERHYMCARGGGQTFNYKSVDINCLSSYFLEKSREEPSAIFRMIDANVRALGWLVLSTHDVSPNPTRFGVTPQLFEAVVDYSIKSGAKILPMRQAFTTCVRPERSGLARAAADPQS